MQQPERGAEYGGHLDAALRDPAESGEAELPQQGSQQRTVEQMQDQAGALEGIRGSWPVACVEQKAQQGQWATGRVGGAGGDIAPEGRPMIDRAGGTEGRQVGEIVEQETAM